MNENLNIEYHHRRLSVKALNKTQKIEDAANLLGITERTLFNWIKKFNIKYDKNKNEYS